MLCGKEGGLSRSLLRKEPCLQCPGAKGYPHKLPKHQKFIANAIYRAVSQDMPEIMEENHLPTNLGSGLFRWNFIIRNLSKAFDADFEMTLQARGAWKLALLRDLISNLSFSIMTESNFGKLQRRIPDHIHYLEALICNNKARRPIGGQYCLSGFERQRDMNVLEELRNQLLSSFSGIVEEHVLILFDYNFMDATSARAVLLTPNMEIALSEDWTTYLKSTFVSRKSILASISDDDETIVKLKPQFEPDPDITKEKRETGSDNFNK